MALRTLSEFKSALAGGGARPNLFEVNLTALPTNINTGLVSDAWDAKTFAFLCKAAQLPASNLGSIDVPFRGRILKVAGDRTYDTWTVTVINDEDFKIRSVFEQWINLISRATNNTGVTNPGSYMTSADVYQYGRGVDTASRTTTTSASTGDQPTLSTGSPLRAYKFVDIFPTNVSAIDLSYDSTDTIEEFTVEFQVQYWTSSGGTATNASAGTIQ